MKVVIFEGKISSFELFDRMIFIVCLNNSKCIDERVLETGYIHS